MYTDCLVVVFFENNLTNMVTYTINLLTMQENFLQAINIIINTLDPDKIILFGSRVRKNFN